MTSDSDNNVISDKRLYRHKGRSQSPKSSFHRKQNATPKGEPWVWITVVMLESSAWQALPLIARQAVDRICIEHMHHAGTENGNLPVSHTDFVAYGIRPHSVKAALNMAEALGWIDQVSRGGVYGDLKRKSRYGLTWLPRCDGTPASNRWRRIDTIQEARAVVDALRPQASAGAGRVVSKAETQDNEVQEDKTAAA